MRLIFQSGRLIFGLIIYFLMTTPSPILAKQHGSIDSLWDTALQHTYEDDQHTKGDFFYLEWPKRANRAQLVWLSKFVQSLDDQRISEENFLSVFGLTGFRRYETKREAALELVKEGTHPQINNCQDVLVGDEDLQAFQVLSASDVDLQSDDDFENATTMLALDYARLQTCLRVLGYDRLVYEQALNKFEWRSLESLAESTPTSRAFFAINGGFPEGEYEPFNSLMDALTLELESQRLRLQPRQPRFISIDGAGAGESSVLIKIVPASGIVARIPRFDYLLCERMQIDPADRQRCHGWSVMRNGDRPFMTGNYILHGDWPSGQQIRTQVSIRNQEELLIEAPRR